MKRLFTFCFILFAVTTCAQAVPSNDGFFIWSEFAQLPPATGQTEPVGLAGAFAGVHNGALIVAGGANFDKPYWENGKSWLTDIWVLQKTKEGDKWQNAGNLEHPLAYGMSISTDSGVICIGGADADKCYSEVFILKWNLAENKVTREELPSLPQPCANGGATLIGNVIYVAGGTSASPLSTALTNFWSLDLAQRDNPDEFNWKTLPAWPGPCRAFNLTIAQHNGKEDCVYVISGRREIESADGPTLDFMTDIYEFSPLKYQSLTQKNFAEEEVAQQSWRECAQLPIPLVAATGAAIGQSHIFIFGGADGSLYQKADELRENHPGFPKDIYAFHTITNTWVKSGQVPQTHVTAPVVKWGEDYLIVSGEVKPRVRTPIILKGTLQSSQASFGAVNFGVLVGYLLLIVAVGFYFATRNKSTDDFFRGGQRVPAWAAGLSIFATLLSSITFIAIPAKVYCTNWTFIILNMIGIATLPFIMYVIMPFFRNADVTSAYEFLEKRFNVVVRLFAATSFILFQIGRMAIVMFLPALALATITPLSVSQCILVMGVLSIIYCTMGGLEAVIWTDAVQSIILLGGAFVSLIIIFSNIDGGFSSYISIANAQDKFHAFNWDFSSTSFVTSALWVMVIGGLGQNIVSPVSDQAVIQRYMSVSSLKKAQDSQVISVVAGVVATFIFFATGTALYVFYQCQPEKLDPTYQNDAIFPLFISHELPIGFAGLVVAGVFAAAQSTISTSMNSISTVFVTDYFQRFNVFKTDKAYLNLARFSTFFFGVLGTGLALLFATADIKSIWESFMEVLGLLGGAMCGLFLAAMFTKRVSGISALIGAFASAFVLYFVKKHTDTSFLLYASIGIAACFIVAWLTSFVFPNRKPG